MAGATVGTYIITRALKYNYTAVHTAVHASLRFSFAPLGPLHAHVACLVKHIPAPCWLIMSLYVLHAGDMAGATVGTYIITRALKYNYTAVHAAVHASLRFSFAPLGPLHAHVACLVKHIPAPC
jgi:hypothetical protein